MRQMAVYVFERACFKNAREDIGKNSNNVFQFLTQYGKLKFGFVTMYILLSGVFLDLRISLPF